MPVRTDLRKIIDTSNTSNLKLMGRRKSARELENQLKYAKAREAYNPPLREEGAATQRRPKTAVKYAVLSPLAEADAAFTIQVSAAGLQFFGGITGLGLAVTGTDPSAPRGFSPAQMHAMVSDSSPSVVRAKGSNRPYVRYGKGARDSNSQYNYSAAVTADTPTNLDTKVKGIFVSVIYEGLARVPSTETDFNRSLIKLNSIDLVRFPQITNDYRLRFEAMPWIEEVTLGVWVYTGIVSDSTEETLGAIRAKLETIEFKIDHL